MSASMRPDAPDITSVGDALEGLVHQFADRWAFLRELVQNAIDAGSEQIDVRVDHDPARGALVIEVADAGEGMSREIIDTRLTRLFSSAKEGDYTKLGRFGIGFVSVFAIDPDLVCVDTGRAGEWWRVVFRRDRSFERIRLGEPVEGTTVRLYKAGGPADLATARRKARETLAYWCKHVKIDLRLCGELVSGPLDLTGHCKVEHSEEGTHLVMALVPERAALRGYYHGGLTLHEEHSDELPHVAFKLDSRWLEHSLTRDNVIRDDNYARAMAVVARVARTRLMTRLFEALADLDATPERDLLYRCAAAHWTVGEPDPAWSRLPVVPLHGRPPHPLAALRARSRKLELWYAPHASPVVERLLADGHLVIDCAADSGLHQFIVTALGESPRPISDLCTALPAADDLSWTPLRAALERLLAASRWKVRAVAVGRFAYPDSPIADRPAISQASPGELTPLADAGKLASGWLASGRVLVLSADHPTLQHLRGVAEREPELAAYLALKSFFLHGELAPDDETALATISAEQRWRRIS